MSQLKIRIYRKSDLQEVRDLHILALKSTGAFAKSGSWDDDLNHIKEIYLKDGEFVVGLLNDKLIAMGAIKKISNAIGEIKRMRVHPDFQRKGFGQLILNKLEKKAKKLGFKKLQLDTTINQVAAQKFYQKNNYIKTKLGQLGGFEIIYYEKKLSD